MHLPFTITGVAYVPCTLAIAFISLHFLRTWRARRTRDAMVYALGFTGLSLICATGALSGMVLSAEPASVRWMVIVSSFLLSATSASFAHLTWTGARVSRLRALIPIGVFLYGIAISVITLAVDVRPRVEPSGGVYWGLPPWLACLRAGLYYVGFFPLVVKLRRELRLAQNRVAKTGLLALILFLCFALFVVLVDFVVEPVLGAPAVLSEIAMVAFALVCMVVYFVLNERIMIENARQLEEDVQRRLTIERELLAARASLETRVAERTAELEQANESLQHEIFERQVTERQLRLKDFAIASSILGIVFTDLDGQIEYANSSFRRLWGYGPDDHTEGTHLLQLWSSEEGGHDVLEVLARSRSYVGEVMARRRDGSRFEAHLSASVVLDEHGGPLRVMASFLDLSESKRAERAREALEAQLRQSQKMESLGSLAGGVAHDMNNMLTAVMGLVCSIQSELGPQSPVQAELESILTACRRGSDLSKNLLGFARKGSYSRQRLSPIDVVKEVQDLLSRTIPKGIVLRTETSLGRSLIVGDASQLQHMLLNLALNSVRAMGDRGELTLAADEVDKPETIGGLPPGRYVRLQVRDTGRGMSPDVLQRAFEPFFTTKGPGEGSGLGLSMVYGTVKNHGGEVVLQSTEGRGTVATVYLPAVEGTPNESPPVPAVAPSDRRPGTVLLVDDEELIRQAARRLLQRLGYEVLEAENGAVAVSLISEQRGKVDVVVLDLVMPVMDGEEAFYRLRELDPELPILLSSGHAREHVAGALLEQGARGFLKKPYTREELAQALQQACAGAPARR